MAEVLTPHTNPKSPKFSFPRRRLALTIVALLLFIGAVAYVLVNQNDDEQQATQSANDKDLYSNADLGFSMPLPDGWPKNYQTTAGKDTVTFLVPDSTNKHVPVFIIRRCGPIDMNQAIEKKTTADPSCPGDFIVGDSVKTYRVRFSDETYTFPGTLNDMAELKSFVQEKMFNDIKLL